jgi:NADP-dependent 3-hydroxy acid dehydrogenase YdfG
MSAPAALVIGGSRGIGLGIACALAADGYGITLAARHADRLEAAADAVLTAGTVVATAIVDLSDPATVDEARRIHGQAHGRLDVLVVAAGRTLAASVADGNRRDVSRLFDVNVVGTADAVRALLPDLRASATTDRPARVLLLGSVAGRDPVAGFATYSASKAAIRSLAASISREEAAHGVLATAISPGYVATDMTAPLRVPTPEEMLPVDDVAEAARFVVRLSARARVDELVIGRVGAGAGEP